MVYFPEEHILTTDSQQMSRRRIMQCLNSCWQISFSHPHLLRHGNSRGMSARVSVFRLPAWARCSRRAVIPATWKAFLAPWRCLGGGFAGSHRRSESRAGTGADECVLGGCDQQRVLAKPWLIHFSFCWAIAGRVPCSGAGGDTDYISVVLLGRKAGSDI